MYHLPFVRMKAISREQVQHVQIIGGNMPQSRITFERNVLEHLLEYKEEKENDSPPPPPPQPYSHPHASPPRLTVNKDRN